MSKSLDVSKTLQMTGLLGPNLPMPSAKVSADAARGMLFKQVNLLIKCIKALCAVIYGLQTATVRRPPDF